jgi:hypothetical protein
VNGHAVASHRATPRRNFNFGVFLDHASNTTFPVLLCPSLSWHAVRRPLCVFGRARGSTPLYPVDRENVSRLILAVDLLKLRFKPELFTEFRKLSGFPCVGSGPLKAKNETAREICRRTGSSHSC